MSAQYDSGTYSLAKRSALADSNLITLLHTESRGNVRGKILVTLLVPGVLGDEVEVFTANDDSSVHLGRDDGAGQDTATDRDLARERALLVCEGAELVFDRSTAPPPARHTGI